MVPSVLLDLGVVASWYPSIEHVAEGRFVADQVAALVAQGTVRPSVISFDPAALVGSGRLRDSQAVLVRSAGVSAIERSTDLFAVGGHSGVANVPVARLPIPVGRTSDDPILHGLNARVAVLDALAGRWAAAPRDRILPPRPRIIHAHTGYPDGAAAARLATALDVPLVITEHATFLDHILAVPERRAAYLAAGRQAVRLIAVSATLGDQLCTALPELSDRIVVIPNAVAVNDFRAAPLAERRPDELLFVGFRRKIKGISTLLRAVAIARRARPTVTLRLIGSAEPALERQWRAEAAGLGIADAVSFEPPAERAGVAAAMARASIFVHASRLETFGVVAAEALASGTPVVATDSGAVPEILAPDPDAMGAVVPRDDPPALAAAIIATLARRASFDPEHMRRSIVERYAGAAVAAALVELYQTVLDDGPADTGRRMRRGSVSRAPDQAAEPMRVVVALDPERARFVAALPDATQAQVVLVTSKPWTIGATALAGSVVTNLHARAQRMAGGPLRAHPSTGWRRWYLAMRHPLALARRRGWLHDVARLASNEGSAAVWRGLALAATRSATAMPNRVVCLDGLDYLAAAPVVATPGVLLEPGGARWLGDRGIGYAPVPSPITPHPSAPAG
jgi:glycogen(starch) synthase